VLRSRGWVFGIRSRYNDAMKMMMMTVLSRCLTYVLRLTQYLKKDPGSGEGHETTIPFSIWRHFCPLANAPSDVTVVTEQLFSFSSQSFGRGFPPCLMLFHRHIGINQEIVYVVFFRVPSSVQL
jgi:hypothetical protein